MYVQLNIYLTTNLLSNIIYIIYMKYCQKYLFETEISLARLLYKIQ